jgi:hypothetical protein
MENLIQENQINMSSFTINVPFEKLRITDEELAKRQELIKKHTKNGKVDLFLVFNEYYEWLSKKRENKNDNS